LKEATKEFRDKSLKIRNDFVDVLQEKLKQVDTEELKDILGRDIYRVREENDRMLQEVRASHEHYKKRQKQLFTGIGAMLLVFMLFALIMTIGSDFMSFLPIDTLQKVIADKIAASEGLLMTFVWYIAYGLPYLLGIIAFVVLYEWIRAKFHD
jgi:ABC-type multidrug transport system fused ATPase/permease subunit